MRLTDLPVPYADRVRSARDAASWTARSISAHAGQWLSWNVCEDFWYRAPDLDRIRAVIDEVDGTAAGLDGAALLTRCASDLQRVRTMSVDESNRLPATAINHVSGGRFGTRYDLAPGSEWAEGSISGEIEPSLPPGTAIQVTPRSPYFRWLTFDHRGIPVSRDPDEVTRNLGLDWMPRYGTVVRVHIPIDALRDAGAEFAIPVLFDVLHDNPAYPLKPDWRARPEAEHRDDEPWGHARDMTEGGPALPEVIADVSAAGVVEAEILGVMTQDWSARPYLTRSSPR